MNRRARALFLFGMVWLSWTGGSACADSIVAVPAASAGSASFMAARDWIWGEAQLLSLAVPALFVFTGFGARIRALCTRLAGDSWYWSVTLFAAAYLTLSALIILPFDYYRGYASLGDMADPLPQWAADELVALAEKVVAALLFAWIPYTLILRSPKRWWLYTTAALAPVAALALVISPIWIKPLTTSFHPLNDQGLYVQIQNLAARCGLRNIPVFVGGGDTSVVGLGPTYRILLGENLLNDQTPGWIRFTIGHELKHYVMGDEYKGLIIIVCVMFTGFFLCYWVGGLLTRRYAGQFGFSQLSDPASLPLFILIFTAFWLCVVPFFNMYARHIEFEADRFGLELTHENRAMAEAEAAYITQGGDSADWDPFFRIFRATHPSDAERIRFANNYRPWAEGKPGVYRDICP